MEIITVNAFITLEFSLMIKIFMTIECLCGFYKNSEFPKLHRRASGHSDWVPQTVKGNPQHNPGNGVSIQNNMVVVVKFFTKGD